jgi:hypothetical protein
LVPAAAAAVVVAFPGVGFAGVVAAAAATVVFGGVVPAITAAVVVTGVDGRADWPNEEFIWLNGAVAEAAGATVAICGFAALIGVAVGVGA